ncbi:ABC transporter substrate-binding protein [Enterocloster sp.]|uniref:ABC transporter substrate-binding protein n=1 Tax=Enterocloster sp. TaxID=2719315 RepID=UPI0039A3F634
MTKKGKRILGVIMGAAVMMAAAGCGQSADSGTKDAQEVKVSENNAENADSAQAESAEEATGTIEMWSMLTQQERADELQKLADSYMEQNPGTQINITVMPWSGAMDKIVSAIMAGNAPDIMVTGTGYPQSLAGTGVLLELSDLVEEIGGKDAFLSTSLTVQGAYEDGLYSVPLYITPYVAYYRDSWLKEAGIETLPTTWEEYYDMCKAVTDPSKDRYGFALPLGDLHAWKTIWSFLQANDVDLLNVDENGEWYIDLDDESRAAMVEKYDYLYKLVKDCAPEGTVGYTQTNVREMVAGGTAMSRIDTPEIYYTLQSVAPDDMDDVSYFKIPGRKRQDPDRDGLTEYFQLTAILALAKDFAKYMFTGDNMVDFYLSAIHMPCSRPRRELFQNTKYQDNLPDNLKEMVPDMALDIVNIQWFRHGQWTVPGRRRV